MKVNLTLYIDNKTPVKKKVLKISSGNHITRGQICPPNCFSSPSRTSLQILDHFTPHRVKPPQLSNKFFHLRFLIHNQILTFATCSKCRGYEIKTFMITRIMDAFFLLYPFLSTSHVLHLFLLTLKYNSN